MDGAEPDQYMDYGVQSSPEGETANFVNPDSIAYQVYITAGVCLTLIVAFSLTRLLSKIYVGPRAIKIDEIIFIIGLLFCLIFFSMTIACVSGSAYGRHNWETPQGAGSFTKSQVVVFYILTWMRIACITGITAITAFQVSLSIAYSAMCAPSTGSSYFDFLNALLSDTCMRAQLVVIIQGIGSVVTDVFLVILPLPAVLGLQIPLKRKIAVAPMFMVGLSACTASIISLVYRVQFHTEVNDNSRLVVPIWATAMAEETAAVMICCTPATAKLFKQSKAPVRSWLSYAKERASRLTGSHRSDTPHSDSQSELKGSLESGRDAAYTHLETREDKTVRIDTDFDAYSLPQINQARTHPSIAN